MFFFLFFSFHFPSFYFLLLFSFFPPFFFPLLSPLSSFSSSTAPTPWLHRLVTDSSGTPHKGIVSQECCNSSLLLVSLSWELRPPGSFRSLLFSLFLSTHRGEWLSSSGQTCWHAHTLLSLSSSGQINEDLQRASQPYIAPHARRGRCYSCIPSTASTGALQLQLPFPQHSSLELFPGASAALLLLNT